ncbi:hypothetical protein WJX81_007229 [Elliptochloris bilobata]|uniref:Uncharacterized protein n=1 Tax=Elliptochloris bilobata TaxID=381761 RepID=A0AAW1RFD0_9CHLO
MKPKGPGSNDRTLSERVINVATSLPFLAVGYCTCRRRQTSEGRQFGAWLMAIGASAAAYHAADGRQRVALRKLDYWTIAAATGHMARAARCSAGGSYDRGPSAGVGGRRWLRGAALAVVTPLQPTLVSALNIAATEVHFARRALSGPAEGCGAAAECRSHISPANGSRVGDTGATM